MKGRRIKMAAIAVVMAAAFIVTPTFAGCIGADGKDGKDGRDGKDLTIYDIWQETKTQTGNPDLTYDEFLREYLSYAPQQIENESSLQTVINRSLLSSVSIITTFDEYVRYGWGGTYIVSEASYYGSGVITDVDLQTGDMTVVTNCHVVYSSAARAANDGKLNKNNGFAKSVQLWLYGSEFLDSESITAEIVGVSKNYDLAVLRISGSDVVRRSRATSAQWVSANDSYVGESVYAVGNADGKKLSSSVGYISKDSEEITMNLGSDSSSEPFEYRVLRTDTAINGGNSGGGLFNVNGEIVGIVNAKNVAQKVDNIGYALPASTSKRVVQRLLENTDGEIGFEYIAGATCEIADSYSTGMNPEGKAEIAEIVQVTNVYGPSSGRLEVNDTVKHVKVMRGETVIEDMPVNRLYNLTDAMISVKPNDTVVYTVLRDGQELEVSVVYSASDYIRKR